MTPELGVVRTGAELVHVHEKRWLAASDLSRPLVVFVHGFTAHGHYLESLARFIGAKDCVAALFNYDSYRGIEQASRELEFMLDDLSEALAVTGFALVGHSMGGLVVRHFAEYSNAACRTSLFGIATLGTPHRGALSRRLISPILDWADAVAMPNPFARSVVCPAAAELTDTRPDGLIARLNEATESNVRPLPMLSVCGGLPYLEFGESHGGFAGTLRNLVLQRLIGEKPNDGLVTESSANITKAIGPAPQRTHRQDYPAYASTNHSYLSKNQQIGTLLRQWLRHRSAGPAVP